jgi:glycosyltransferase involved in cell wall biosynthesis
MLTKIRSFAKRTAPDWLTPALQKGFLFTQQMVGKAQNLYDVASLELSYKGQTPRVYFPTSMGRTHAVWRTYLTDPPVAYVPFRRADLCHWINTMPDNPAVPCIVECEHILALAGNITDWQWGLQRTELINRLVGQEQCRLVLTYSAGLVKHSRRYLRPDLWHKVGVVYQVFPTQPELPKPADRPFTILSIASRFSDKGVPEVLETYRILRSRYGTKVELVLVCQAVPKGYHIPEGVIHHDIPRMSDSFKEQVYRNADVLFIPAYSDTAGCFPEAFAFGVPAITTRIHHDDDFVQDDVTGFLIDTPVYSYSDQYGERWRTWQEFLDDLDVIRAQGRLQTVVEQSVAFLDRMITGQVNMAAMSQAARRFHAETFTPEVRNVRLRQIYALALARGGDSSFSAFVPNI